MSQIRSGLETRRATRVLISLNVMLLLALIMQWTPPAPAAANPNAARRPQGVVNPADQRKDIINELRRLNKKIDALNEKLSRPFDVKVVQMPSGQED